MSSGGRVGTLRAGDPPPHPRGLLVPSPSPVPRRGKCFPAGELAALRSAEGRKSPCFPPVWWWLRACGLCVFLFFFFPSCAVLGAAGVVGSAFPAALPAPASPGGFLGWFAPRSPERGSGCGGWAGAARCPFPEANRGALRAELWRVFCGRNWVCLNKTQDKKEAQQRGAAWMRCAPELPFLFFLSFFFHPISHIPPVRPHPPSHPRGSGEGE